MSLINIVNSVRDVREVFDTHQTHAVYRVYDHEFDCVKQWLKDEGAYKFRVVKPMKGIRILCFAMKPDKVKKVK